jgi:hypothetical protein
MPTTTQYAYANNVSTTLATAISSSATTITLASSANFPTIPTGFVWAVTLNDHATQSIFEIVYVTATSGANLTVLRGQEGTAARAWNVGDYVFAPDTAGILNSFVDQAYLNSLGLLTYAGLFNPRNYGALGNGSTNDAAAFTAANTASAGSQIYVPPGNYLISSSIAITSPIIFAAGAKLILSGSATATFTYTPQAGRYQIFAGTALTSRAVFMFTSAAAVDPLYPEWWGAQVAPSSIDNGPAFTWCAQALAALQGGSVSLASGNYTFASSVVWTGLNGLSVFGQGGNATTLSWPNGFTGQGITIGGATSGAPCYNIRLGGFQIYQDFGTGPIGPTTGVSGLYVQYAISTILENIIVQNWAGGVYYKSVTDCFSKNVSSFTSYAQYQSFGFYCDGTVSQNASLYFEFCLCSHGSPLSSITTYGLYSFCGSGTGQSVADLYIANCEFDQCNYGVYVNGAGSTYTYGAIDIRLYGVVCDNNKLTGFFFNNLFGDASVKVTDCYVEFASGTVTGNGVIAQNSSGVKITNLEAFAPTSTSGSYYAVNLVNSPSCQVHGLIIRGYFQYGVFVQSGSHFATITNGDLRTDATVTSSNAIGVIGATNAIIANNHIYGTGSATWGTGIDIAGASDYYRISNNDVEQAFVSGFPYLLLSTLLNGYVDYQTAPAWTITDQSGAALAITVNSNWYVKIGRFVSYQFDITYPTNSNASSARINAPTNSPGSNFPGATVAPPLTSGGSSTITGVVTAGLIIFSPQSSGASQFANLNLSGFRITVSGTYESAY